MIRIMKYGEEPNSAIFQRSTATADVSGAVAEIIQAVRKEGDEALRRFEELKAKVMPADYDDILKNVQERDYIDSHREVSPLRQADDALLLDNSDMTISEQKEWLMERFRETTKISK